MRGARVGVWAVGLVALASGACDGRNRPPASAGTAAESTPGGPAIEAARGSGDEFDVVALREATVRVGAATRIAVVATPKEGWKINLEYPAKLKVIAADTFTVDRTEWTLDDAVRKDIHELRFEIATTPATAGPRPIELQLKVGLCDPSRCVTRTVRLAWTYEVEG
jgi:hypothetical protein